MNGTTHGGGPPYTTTGTRNAHSDAAYDVGLACIVLLVIIILCYVSYKCKLRRDTLSLPLTITSIQTVADSDSDDDRCMRLSTGGLHDDILSTFPTFIYSEAVKTTNKSVSTEMENHVAIDYGSGCSICLADYRPAEVVRLLPECGHLYHLSCIDAWLKVQTTCPICRKSLPTLTA